MTPAGDGAYGARTADSTQPQARRKVIRDSLGVGLAVGAYRAAFGAGSVAEKLSLLQTVLLSLFRIHRRDPRANRFRYQ